MNEVRAVRAQGWSSALWTWPAVSGAAALLAGAVLLRLRPPPSSAAARWAWPGDADSAATMAQTVAASVITVTSLTFSLTVVALQLASQQFSPRLLREFARDLVTRVVLAVLVATFVLAVTVLRGLRADRPVPGLAVLAVFVLGLVSLGALLGFITHLVRVLRVDTMMLTVHDEADQAIAVFYPAYEDGRPQHVDDLPVAVTEGAMVRAERSGFVRLIDVAGLVEGAREEDAVVRVEVRPGDHVVRGAPVATVWSRHGGSPQHLDAVQRLVRNCVVVGYERTVEQDAAYGFRQLEDIAVKALSPGINDPVTAVHAIGHLGDLLVRIVNSRLGPTLHEDQGGVGRAVVPDRDFAYYLDLSCGQVRRFGSGEPTVLVALLRMLREVAASARDDQQREQIDREARLVVASAAPSLLPEDREQVEQMGERVRLVLRGQLSAAYGDRAGETRSL